MSGWSLPLLLSSVHEKIQLELELARKSLHHTTTKGDASEAVWIQLFNEYLPERYCTAKAQVVDSDGRFSDQIDLVVFDRQYSHFVFNFKGQLVLPVECVYAVFEAKQSLTSENVAYAKAKALSVRSLRRTSAPIFSMGKMIGAADPQPILAGLLALESGWSPPLSGPFLAALGSAGGLDRLDCGCVAAHGRFGLADGAYTVTTGHKPATSFLLEFMGRLQRLGTVPAIEFSAYAKWLDEPEP